MSSTAESRTVLLLTTLGADTDAAAFARALIEERLAACVNVLPPMLSVYRWKGDVEEAREQQLLIKTTAARVPDLETRFRALHPYELPEFVIVQPDEVGRLFANWVEESVQDS